MKVDYKTTVRAFLYIGLLLGSVALRAQERTGQQVSPSADKAKFEMRDGSKDKPAADQQKQADAGRGLDRIVREIHKELAMLPYYGVFDNLASSSELSLVFGQTSADTIVGCLTRGDRPTFYTLRQSGGGSAVQVTGDLDRYAGNNEVRLRGTIQRDSGVEVFRVTDAEQLSTRCAAVSGVPNSLEELRESVGSAAVGVRGGIGLDPELIYLGAHAQMGPFVKNIWFRPSYEFGFGEVTQIQSLNLEFAYYLPFTGRASDGSPRGSWNTYIGAGPALHLVRQSFDKKDFKDVDIEIEDFDFTDWDFDRGLNLVMGVSRRNGMFIELRAGAYGSPSVKIIVGTTFRR